MNVKKGWQLFCYYDLREFCGKAWEKYVIDRKRFGGVINEAAPTNVVSDDDQIQDLSGTVDGSGPAVCWLVHFFYPDKSGGTERFVLNQAKAKLARGGIARVITLSIGPVKQYPNRTGNILWRDYEYEGVPITEYRYKKSPCGVYYKRIGEDRDLECFAQMILAREQFEVVHCAFPQPFTGFLNACTAQKIPYIVTNTGFGIFCHYTTLINRDGCFCTDSCFGTRCEQTCPTYGVADYAERFRLSEQILRRAAAVTSPSLYVSQRLEAEYPGLRVLTVPHGIDNAFVPGKRSWQGIRFAYVGTFVRLKGIHVLIKAFRALSGEYSLDLYGSGDSNYEKELKRMAKGDGRITFHGYVDPSRVVEVYQQHDIVVIPSLVPETYCFVLREALSCGCMAVASNIGAIPEAIQVGKTGLLCPPGDIVALLHALEQATALCSTRRGGSRSPDTTWENFVYENLYRRVQHSN